ncbi:protein phosphatase 2C 53-like isoform X1 [Typha latifolia]|uniref:protein phosphatase 2C 53-like isoform X1 n=1 Tax=Typha latifolia TaxID=4733 RepID=UPI003C2D303C
MECDPELGIVEAEHVVEDDGAASSSGQVAVAEGAVERRRARCLWRRGGAAMMTWGSATAVGRRREMEDAVAVVPEFMSATCEGVGGCAAPGSGEISHVRFFGVYDGHGGSQVANYCAKRIHEVLAEQWGRTDDEQGWKRRWEVAFNDGFDKVDNEVIADGIAPDIIGSTAVVVVVSGCQIIAANCGDSRAVLCRGNQTIQLTVDHKFLQPDREDELARIESAGGRVMNWKGPRVLGVLAMSRSIGDRYMRPWIIPVPEVTFLSRNEDDECLIVASDGLWDVISNEEIGDLACRLLRRHRRNGLVEDVLLPAPAQAVADHLVRIAYRKNSSDNISVIVVDLKTKSRRRPRH